MERKDNNSNNEMMGYVELYSTRNCFVCGNRMAGDMKCQYCKTDYSMEYEGRKTLAIIPQDSKTIIKRRSEYLIQIMQPLYQEIITEKSNYQHLKEELEIKNQRIAALVKEISSLKKKQSNETDNGSESHSKMNYKPVKGATFPFGYYPQSKAGDRKPIEWRILAVKGGDALVQSVYALDVCPFHYLQKEVTWDHSWIQNWLNSTFYKEAFTEEEKKRIQVTTVCADKNPYYNTYSGEDVKNAIFLLSIKEAENLYASDRERRCIGTEYVLSKGALANDATKCCFWWLRTSGRHKDSAAGVNAEGMISTNCGLVGQKNICIRPAMWIHF